MLSISALLLTALLLVAVSPSKVPTRRQITEADTVRLHLRYALTMDQASLVSRGEPRIESGEIHRSYMLVPDHRSQHAIVWALSGKDSAWTNARGRAGRPWALNLSMDDRGHSTLITDSTVAWLYRQGMNVRYDPWSLAAYGGQRMELARLFSPWQLAGSAPGAHWQEVSSDTLRNADVGLMEVVRDTVDYTYLGESDTLGQRVQILGWERRAVVQPARISARQVNATYTIVDSTSGRSLFTREGRVIVAGHADHTIRYLPIAVGGVNRGDLGSPVTLRGFSDITRVAAP
jgi:hypothetical protein